MKSFRIRHFLFAVLAGLSAGLSSTAYGDETEVYLGDLGGSTGTIKPNVLFVLDTSSSMTNIVTGTGKSRLENMKDALLNILTDANNINAGLMRFSTPGGPVLYPVADLEADVTTIEGSSGSGTAADVTVAVGSGSDDATEVSNTTTLTGTTLGMGEVEVCATCVTITPIRVSNNDDDAEEQVSNGSMNLNSSDLELVTDGGNAQIVGIRFQNVNVPKDAVILSASVEFEVDVAHSGTTNLTIKGQASDNATTFSNTNYNISGRTATAAAVSWSNVAAPAVDAKLTTPDLSTVVQEVVNRGSWASGNAMAFIITGTAGSLRELESRNGESGAAPLLRVSYRTGAATTAQQTVGLRFNKLNIPQGVSITNARIQFRSAISDQNSATALTIKAQAADDAATFAATSSNITGRSMTSAAVSWNASSTPALDTWTLGPDVDPDNGTLVENAYETPNLKDVVQEVVNRSNWCGGNSMVLTLAGTGLRTAMSYEGDPTLAPVLVVDYDHTSFASGATGCVSQTLQAQVNTSNDDAEESSSGVMTRDSSDLEMIKDSSDQVIGIRFTSLDIPQGATIVSASLEFTAKDDTSTSTSLTIYGHANDNSPSFSSSANDVSGRTKTSASAAWSSIPSWTTSGKYQSPELKTIVQEIVNRSGWTPKNNMSFIVTGTSNSNRRAWSFDGNAAGAPVLRVTIHRNAATEGTSSVITVRHRLKELVSQLDYRSYTPTIDTLYEAARYWRGEGVEYGKKRGDAGSRAEYTRVSHPASYTGGTVVRDAGCTDANLNATACRTEEITGSPVYKSPITHACQSNYMILLTDGAANSNNSVDEIQSLIGETCEANSTAGFVCGLDIVDFLQNTDQKTTIADKQTILTHTIGFNFTNQFTKDLATRGGGDFYEANTASELTEVFETIVANAITKPTSYAAPALSINAFNKLTHRNEVYFSLFEPANDKRWKGNIKKFKLCDDEDECSLGEILDANDESAIDNQKRISADATSVWTSEGDAPDGVTVEKGGAGSKIPAYGSRKVYTSTGTNLTLTANENKVADNNTNLTKTLLGNASMTDAERTSLIEWILGKDVDDEDDDTVTDENRWALEDPLHASPVAITIGGSADSPVTALFAVTNGGGLRMFDASTGVEKWMYIPKALLSIQKDLRANGNGSHIYGLDLTPTPWVYDKDGDGLIEDNDGDFVRLIIGMRRGGKNIYAIDVTPTDDDSVDSISPELMWIIEGGTTGFANLGQTWSQPKVAKVNVGGASTDVVIFAGGNDDTLDKAFGSGTATTVGNIVYLVNASTGALITSIGGPSTGAEQTVTGMEYPITAEVTVMDYDGDKRSDRIYVGDLGGNVWRIDLKDTLTTSSTGAAVSTVGKLANLALDDGATAGTLGANSRSFYAAPDVVKLHDATYSSTADYDLVLIASGHRPHPLDKAVHNSFFAIRDFQIANLSDLDKTPTGDGDGLAEASEGYTTVTRGDGSGAASELLDVTSNALQKKTDGTPTDVTAFTAAKEKLRASSGWYIDLKDGDSFIGEKGLSKPLVLAGKLFFTTYVPEVLEASADSCDLSEGYGYLYGMDVLTGAALFSDWNSSGGDDPVTADRHYQLGGGVPSEVVPVYQQDGVTILVGTGGGAVSQDPGIDFPRLRTFWRADQ